MKEHYVSLDAAQVLKQLGFVEKVNHAYLKKISIEPELSVGDLKEVHSKCPKNFNDNRKGITKGIEFCSAPRLDQAAAWLLKKKGYYIELPFTAGNGLDQRDGYLYTIVGTWSYKTISCYTCFDSPEKALSAGIDELLKLLGKEVKE